MCPFLPRVLIRWRQGWRQPMLLHPLIPHTGKSILIRLVHLARNTLFFNLVSECLRVADLHTLERVGTSAPPASDGHTFQEKVPIR